MSPSPHQSFPSPLSSSMLSWSPSLPFAFGCPGHTSYAGIILHLLLQNVANYCSSCQFYFLTHRFHLHFCEKLFCFVISLIYLPCFETTCTVYRKTESHIILKSIKIANVWVFNNNYNVKPCF